MAKSKILETLEAAEKVRPIAKKNGKEIVTFQDAVTLANADGFEPPVETGVRKYNPDGTIAGVRTRTAAINPNYYFANRYRVTGKLGARKMNVCIDWRAISEQSGGRCYAKTLPVYVFARNESGELYIEKIDTISDTEFLSEYTNMLDNANMAKLAKLIADFGTETATTEMPI